MPQVALISRAGRVCILGALVLTLCAAAGCGTDKLKKEIEDKNKTIVQLDELKSKAEADLAAKDQELAATVDKLQKQNADTKRQLDNCGATLAELRAKVKALSKSAKSAEAKNSKTAKTDKTKSETKTKAKTKTSSGREGEMCRPSCLH
jgi:preprotein translocase subunit SecF